MWNANMWNAMLANTHTRKKSLASKYGENLQFQDNHPKHSVAEKSYLNINSEFYYHRSENLISSAMLSGFDCM